MRKVFGIVAFQMGVTMSFAIIGAVFKPAFVKNPIVLLLALIAVIVGAMMIMWGTDIRKKVPHNYAILIGFTLGEALFFCGLTAKMDPQAVVSAIVALFSITGTLFVVTWNC